MTQRWRLVTVACLVVATAAALLLLCWLRHRPSADEQLRAIDAAHAISDAENAARDYTKQASCLHCQPETLHMADFSHDSLFAHSARLLPFLKGQAA